MNTPVFEFTNYDVEVIIAGHKFTMDCSTDTGDYLKKVAGELHSLADEYSKGQITKENILAYGRKIIDNLLGEGAAETVLAGRKHKISDITDICLFLAQIAAEFQAKKKSQTQNRAQRRAQKK